MRTSTPSMTIGALAASAGVHVETIRYYQRRGLVAEPARPHGGVRRYSQEDAEQLRFIKRAQGMGFTLAEIDVLVALRKRRSCRATRELAVAKLRLIDTRLRELRHLRQEIARLVAECSANTEDEHCPVIDRLTQTRP